MDEDLSSEANPLRAPVDKSRVLEVEPLRCLVPAFPNPPGMSSFSTAHVAPFSCIRPSGPFPSGVHPFYPLVISDGFQHFINAKNEGGNFGHGSDIPSPVPFNSYRSPTPQENGIKVQSLTNSVKRSTRRTAESVDDIAVESLVRTYLTSFNLNKFEDLKRSSGDEDTVRTILLVYNLLRKKLTQLDEARDVGTGISRRPSLKAGTLLMTKGIRTNSMKRIGQVPGIEVGDIFFFRMELCIVGLHAQSMSGIDYLSVRSTLDEEPVAVSIVSSGEYDDAGEGGDILIFSGQGGVQRRDGQMFDQKLEKGNLALEKSLHHANDVRVIRGIKDGISTGKIYVYDGLYKIRESWVEKNKSGCNVFKYKLVRVPGQPEAYSLWKSIQEWKDGSTTQTGCILHDLASGAESLPVSLVNNVDGEKGPAHFTYVSSLKCLKPFQASKCSPGCHCIGGCQPGNNNCSCSQSNNGFLPYSSSGVLLSNNSIPHECGQNCACPPNCRNRISQAGIKVRLEVFKTTNKGWGLRSWDPIREGAFICEYAGDVIGDSRDLGNEGGDNFVFDATRYYEPLEAVCEDSPDSRKSPYPLRINSKYNGNVARFMNHSCSPNVFWQPVLRESNYNAYLHIALFAIKHIPPMQELTYNYGIILPERREERKRKCLCKSVKCRGYFY